ncbi:hypothetical protein ACFLWZ_02130 [Chloroflexota bacterium]
MAQKILPDEFDLKTTRRYQRQNMAKAMRGKIERGLVELITNSDDSYRDQEEEGVQPTGKILIEVERKRGTKPSIIKVRDRAGGMTDEELCSKIGVVGERTSGFENGKARRGLHGRGAKDVAIFGGTHFESIKDDKYSHLVITPFLVCRRQAKNERVTKEIRDNLGILRGNGTVVTIEMEYTCPIPLHNKLADILSRYYSLRDIMANPNREVTLSDVNSGKLDRLTYKYPEGNIVHNEIIELPGYRDAKAHLLVRQHDTSFQNTTMPLREGILVKSSAAIHDCTYFQLESEPYSWRFSGELLCDYMDELIREYDDAEVSGDHPTHSSSNPVLLLSPDRDGLVEEHPFTAIIKQKCRQILHSYIDNLKGAEVEPKRPVTDEYLNKKLDRLSKEISRPFEKKLKELDEDILSGTESVGILGNLPIGLHIIPPGEEPIVINAPKVFTVKVVGPEPLDDSIPVTIESSNTKINVRTTPVFLRRFSEDRRIGTTTFVLESETPSEESLIEIRYDGYDNLLLITTIEPPPPRLLPDGLSFDKPKYQLQINKEKSIYLWLKNSSDKELDYLCSISSNNSDVVVKGGGKCYLRKTESSNIYQGKCRVIGRRSKVKATITVSLDAYEKAQTAITIEEKEPSSHIKLEFIPDEDDFGSVRYKWDEDKPYILKIAAKHPSIRQYLGTPIGDEYPGRDSPLYYSVLAEVVAEALAFYLLERQFKTEGQQGMLDYTTVDANFHKHYSDFLAICHQNLNPGDSVLAAQPKLL